MALTEFLILRKPRSGCLEERTALIHPIPSLNADIFARSDAWTTFEDFLRLCNITRPPHVERGLFT